ncbi:hypothetical protein AUP68_11549 [Ilyonectria robusta]
MAEVIKKTDAPAPAGGVLEKEAYCSLSSQPFDTVTSSSEPEAAVQTDLIVTEDDLLEAKEIAATLSLEEVRTVGPLRNYSLATH